MMCRSAHFFRDMVAPQLRWPRKRYVALTALAVVVLAALAVLLAYDRRVAAIYVGTAAAVFVLLRVVAALLMMVAKRLPRPHSAGSANGDRQHSSSERINADNCALAWAGVSRCW